MRPHDTDPLSIAKVGRGKCLPTVSLSFFSMTRPSLIDRLWYRRSGRGRGHPGPRSPRPPVVGMSAAYIIGPMMPTGQSMRERASKSFTLMSLTRVSSFACSS